MKKIIKIGLLSTVAFCHVVFAANPEENPDGSVNGVVITGESVQNPSTGGDDAPSDEQIEGVTRMLAAVEEGVLPQEILEAFSDLPKIDVGQRSDIDAMQANLKATLETRWTNETSFFLNAFLAMVAKTLDPLVLPLAESLFGKMSDDLTFNVFIDKLSSIYTTLFADERNIITTQINTPMDWVTFQFLGLFFNNAIPKCVVNINIPGLGNVDLITKVVEGLKEASLNILGLWGVRDDVQVEILQNLIEILPKKAKIISDAANVSFIKSFIESLTDPSLPTIVDDYKIQVLLVVDLSEVNRHRVGINNGVKVSDDANFHERESALIRMFEDTANRSAPNVWDLQLQIGNFESIAYSSLTPMVRSVVQSPIGVNLSLPTLVSDHPTAGYVIKRLREEFASPESKVQVLNFEGSQLSDEGWEQLALLAETQKPLHKLRLTGMQIPSSVAGRLGMFRVQGINMVGCRLNAADLTDMVSGWLGDGSILRGVDLRGNEVNAAVISLFVQKGFEIYQQIRIQPHGYMFAKP
jgi:hypothetical protein